MFSKEESAQLRKQFSTSFGKSFPRKFQADKKKAAVCLNIEHSNELTNQLLYDKMESLKILLEIEVPKIIYDSTFLLNNGKTIHRIYVPFQDKFNIYNKNT